MFKKMSAGIKFSSIKVENGLICYGHHRYIAFILANFSLESVPGIATSATTTVHWQSVIFEEEDWDTLAKIDMLNEQDAEYNNIPIEKIVKLLEQCVNLTIMLLFLDIDGVMVPAKSWKSPELLNDGFPAFSIKATSVLQRLISEDVIVMLTTSHKSKFSIEEWKSIFGNRGINIEKIKSLPENIDNLTRKDEILNWFSTNINDKNFIIIDDDKSLNDLPPFLKDNLVLTSPYIGLTEEHSELIKSIMHKALQTAI